MSVTPMLYNLDSRHFGVRFLPILFFVIGPVLSLAIIIPTLFDILNLSPISEIITSLLFTITFTWGGSTFLERIFLKYWPSNRWLEANSNQISIRKKSLETVINWSERVNILSWHFVIKRGKRSWIPNGWYCLSCQLIQDEEIITFYTFLNPEAAEALPQWRAFELLISRKNAPKQGEEYKLAKIGEQGRLRAAEDDRYNNGSEMKSEDFIELIKEMELRLEGWPAEA